MTGPHPMRVAVPTRGVEVDDGQGGVLAPGGPPRRITAFALAAAGGTARYVSFDLVNGHGVEVDDAAPEWAEIVAGLPALVELAVDDLAAALDALQERTGLDVPIHVDGASGAMIAPFLQPEIEWDFRLERVHSISTSGHKYGLVYPGVGWVVWRTRDGLPEELVFRVSYLGGNMPTLALNFSRPGAQVLLQYFQFLRLGREGYTAIQQECQDVARYVAHGIEEIGAFELWNDGSDIPVFAWRLTAGRTESWGLYHLSNRLRTKGWLVPAYPMPDDLADLTVQRIVERDGVSRDLASELLEDIRVETAWLDGLASPMPAQVRRSGLHH